MSKFLYWFGIIVICLSFTVLFVGCATVVSDTQAQVELARVSPVEQSVSQTIGLAVGVMTGFSVFAGVWFAIYLVGLISYFVGNSGRQRDREFAAFSE